MEKEDIEMDPNSTVDKVSVGPSNRLDVVIDNSERKEGKEAREIERQPSMLSTYHVPEKEQLDFVFDHIVYSVIDKTTKQPRTLLNGISGVVKPGTVLGVMGPSGCGKTTLLDFLAGRLSTGTSHGTVYVGGEKRNAKKFHHIAKYVPQEDHLIGTMSVEETLWFSADLSLPEETSHKEKKQRVNAVIEDLGLKKTEKTRIGTVFQKGISGGQKRRVSMGVELLTLPNIIFLDEPTSGLDSAAAERVVQIMHRLADSGRVVICTIHQPNSEVFLRLDQVLFLSTGNVVYFGPTKDAVKYFESAGYRCPEYVNPADFIMDIINTDFDGEKKGEDDVLKLVASYKESKHRQELDAELEQVRNRAGKRDDDEENLAQLAMDEADFSVPFFKQFWYLAKRNWLDNLRNPGIFWVRLVMYVMLSAMIATLYANMGDGQNRVQDRISILFFIAAFLVFMSISVIPMFIQDRSVFTRERANGWYHVGAYVLANTVCSIPGIFVIALFSSLIIFWSINLHGSFGVFLADLFVSLFVAESLMLVISACVPIYIIGMALGAGIYGMFMLNQGFFLIRDNIPPYWIWCYYIGFHTWTFQIFMYNEFHNSTVDCNPSTEICRYTDGNAVLKQYGMENSNIGEDFAILVCMAIIYRIIFFAILQKFHKGKR